MAAAGGCGGDSAAGSSGAIRRDYHGTIRVPAGATLVTSDHDDPYRWTARLRFEGDASPVWSSLADNLRSLRFRLDDRMTASPVTACHRGALDADGMGECFFNVNLD